MADPGSLEMDTGQNNSSDPCEHDDSLKALIISTLYSIITPNLNLLPVAVDN